MKKWKLLQTTSAEGQFKVYKIKFLHLNKKRDECFTVLSVKPMALVQFYKNNLSLCLKHIEFSVCLCLSMMSSSSRQKLQKALGPFPFLLPAVWVVWQPLGAKGLLRSGFPQLYASGPASQANPVSSLSPPVPYGAAHQAHREQRGTRDPSNCPCFGQLSGKPAWRRPPVPRLFHCSPLNPHSEILWTI